MINWSCIIQGQSGLQSEPPVAGRSHADALRALPPPPAAALPSAHLPPLQLHSHVSITVRRLSGTEHTLLSQQIPLCSVFSIHRHKRMGLAQREAGGLCGLLSALGGLGQVISNLPQCSHYTVETTPTTRLQGWQGYLQIQQPFNFMVSSTYPNK